MKTVKLNRNTIGYLQALDDMFTRGADIPKDLITEMGESIVESLSDYTPYFSVAFIQHAQEVSRKHWDEFRKGLVEYNKYG